MMSARSAYLDHYQPTAYHSMHHVEAGVFDIVGLISVTTLNLKKTEQFETR